MATNRKKNPTGINRTINMQNTDEENFKILLKVTKKV